MGRTRAVAVLLVVLVAAGLLATESSAVAGGATTDPAPAPARAWAPEWMVRDTTTYTEAEAREVARRYDVVAAHANTFKGLVPAMKDENPRLRILIYVNGPFGASYLPDYPASWYARNASGGRVKAVRFDNYLMDVHLPQWRAEVLRLCKETMASSGYDGCFLDSLGNGIIKSGYLDSDPIDPRTLKPWTLDTYINDTAGIAAYVRANLPGVTVAANGLGSGPRYFNDGTTKLADSTDIAMAEAWLRGADAAADAWPKLTQWRQNVDMIADAESRGSGVLTVTKLWTTVTNAQREQWYEYSLASFLLGTGPHSRFFFIKDGCKPPCTGKASPLSGQWAPDGALGDPQGPYRAAGAAFVRDFANGFVAVNPGDTAVAVTPPAGTYTDQDGATVSGSVTLAPHTGLLLQADAVTPPPPPPPPPPPDPVAPTVAVASTATVAESEATAVAGLASDDSAVVGVSLQIKDSESNQWMRADGTWGDTTADLSATLATPGQPQTGWSHPWSPTPGRYAVFVNAVDDEGLTSPTALQQVTVVADQAGPAPVLCQGLEATIVGTDGPDDLSGTTGPDVIAGLGGDDRILGLAGDDVICGGDGNDRIEGGGGADTISAGAGDDTVLAGAGADTVYAGDGIDRVQGGDQADRIWGGAGADRLLGNRGDDVLAGDGGTDVCSGGAGTGDRATECEKTPWVEVVT